LCETDVAGLSIGPIFKVQAVREGPFLYVYPFGPYKKHLAGKRFAAVANVKQAVTSWLHTLETDFFHAEILAMESR
jgi:hypothetical protein